LPMVHNLAPFQIGSHPIENWQLGLPASHQISPVLEAHYIPLLGFPPFRKLRGSRRRNKGYTIGPVEKGAVGEGNKQTAFPYISHSH